MAHFGARRVGTTGFNRNNKAVVVGKKNIFTFADQLQNTYQNKNALKILPVVIHPVFAVLWHTWMDGHHWW